MRIKRTDLLGVLLDAVHEAGIALRYDKRITSITDGDGRVEVKFSDGTTDTADLLLGCDGIHSAVRTLYVDPSQSPTYTGMSGLGSIVPASVLPSFLPHVRGMNVTLTQEGMFAAMTCTADDQEICWGFSKEAPLPPSGDARDGWEVHRKQEVEGFKSTLLELLHDAGGQWGNTMRTLVSKTDVVKFYPVYKLPLGGEWHRGRVLLLGDAAHAMPPHAGQGVSMALEDAFLLSRLLEHYNANIDISRSLQDVYKRFDKIRRPRVDEISTRAAGNAEMRKKTGPWGLWLKEQGISLYLHGSWALGMDKWGSETKYIVYDIDEAEV